MLNGCLLKFCVVLVVFCCFLVVVCISFVFVVIIFGSLDSFGVYFFFFGGFVVFFGFFFCIVFVFGYYVFLSFIFNSGIFFFICFEVVVFEIIFVDYKCIFVFNFGFQGEGFFVIDQKFYNYFNIIWYGFLNVEQIYENGCWVFYDNKLIFNGLIKFFKFIIFVIVIFFCFCLFNKFNMMVNGNFIGFVFFGGYIVDFVDQFVVDVVYDIFIQVMEINFKLGEIVDFFYFVVNVFNFIFCECKDINVDIDNIIFIF